MKQRYDKETIKAIKLSIKKWKGLAENGFKHDTYEYWKYIKSYTKYHCECPLCELLLNESCEMCPLMYQTGNHCANSKSYYYKWRESRFSRTASKYAQKIVEALEECLK